MIGILDPALLLPRPGDEASLETELDHIAQLCHTRRIELPQLDEYWPDLWRQLGQDLERSVSSHRARQALRELRKRGRPPHGVPPLGPAAGRVYGLRTMFDLDALGPGWLGRMTKALARASFTGAPTVLLTRRMQGRNLRSHAAANSQLDEVTRWFLYLHLSGSAPRSIHCVHHPRNLSPDLRWTTRFDWRLPAAEDGARYPFCPPPAWWKQCTPAVTTMRSKPVFLDAKGNGWARPNIERGSGHHWDVYIADVELARRIGLDQLNIVEVGAPPSEGSPGSIHHVPGKKEGRRREHSGWSC